MTLPCRGGLVLQGTACECREAAEGGFHRFTEAQAMRFMNRRSAARMFARQRYGNCSLRFGKIGFASNSSGLDFRHQW